MMKTIGSSYRKPLILKKERQIFLFVIDLSVIFESSPKVTEKIMEDRSG